MAALLAVGITTAATNQVHAQDVTAAKPATSTAGKVYQLLKGSSLRFSTYMGSGTFVRKEFSDNPYVSQELLLYPKFNISERQAIRAYWIVECEYTEIDSPNARRCSPSDVRLSYHFGPIWKHPVAGSIAGNAGVWLPTSYESRFSNNIFNWYANVGYNVSFWKNRIDLGYGFLAQKYFHTSKTRGTRVGDQFADDGLAMVLNRRTSAGLDGSVGSGGRMNDNWLIRNNFHLGVNFTKKLSLSIDLLIYNYVRYSVPSEFSDPARLEIGRGDSTWGITEVSYQLRDWVSLALGISSLQPALTADNKSVRFPFYDFISPYNNFTKWYLSATFTL